MQESWVQSVDWKDPMEKGMATHSSILAWRIPRTQEPGRLQSVGSQSVGHDWVTHIHTCIRMNKEGTSLVGQWLRFWAPNAGGPGSIPHQGTRSHMPQLTSSGGLVAKSCPTLVTPWAAACQAPLPMGFYRQEYWSGLPSAPPGESSWPRDQTHIS